jgi:ABC-2 type transport system ATP-binding protein
VSFEVGRGEVVGFLGPNGAGKSTTVRILTGLLRAHAGEAWVEGHSLARAPEKVQQLLGYMPENNPLPEDLRVGEFLRYRAALKGLHRRHEREERVAELLVQCDLQRETERKRIGKLSKGYRQRVGLADALLARPRVVLLDEPTLGLDPHQVLGFRRLIEGLRGALTLVLSSHILSEVERLCDRSVILNRGQVVAAGTSGELREQFAPGRCYEIRVEGPLTEIEDRIQRVDRTLRREEAPSGNREGEVRCLRYSSPAKSDLSPALVDALQAGGEIQLHGLRRAEASLEDIFLAATRPSWKERQLPEQGEARPAGEGGGA